MSNVLTALQPTLFSAAQEVASEPFGCVDAVNVNFDDRRVAYGDSVTVPIAPTRAAADYTPAMTPSAGDSATAASVEVEITKSRKVSWNLTGEQQRSLENGPQGQGSNFDEWVRQLMRQGMRTLRNEAEVDCATAVQNGISRAVDSTSGAPFSTNINAMVDARKILHDNGAPLSDLQMVMDTSQGAALRKLGIIQQADQAGSPEERRSGNLLRQFGFALRESAGISQHSAGAATGYQTNGATADGALSVAIDTGSGAFNENDLVTIDGNTYLVNAAGSGPITINRPGANGAIADDTAVSEVGNYTPILAFERDAVVAIMRPPVTVPNANISEVLISDATGMTYLLQDIRGYGMRTWELHLAWGFKAVETPFITAIAY